MHNFIDIVFNLGMLASLSILSGFISIKATSQKRFAIFQGILFGSGAMLGMLHPLVLAPGLIFDGRSVMISVCTLFFGPVAGGISAIMAAALRISQGGSGAHMGVLVITASAVIGYLFRMHASEKESPISAGRILAMGIAVHITMVLLMFTLPGDQAMNAIRTLGMFVVIAYPLATLLCGMILSEARQRNLTQAALKTSLEALAASEENFRSTFQGASDAMMLFSEEIIIDCNWSAANLLGDGTLESVMGKTVMTFSPEYQKNGEKSEIEARNAFKACFRESHFRLEWLHKRMDGTLVPVDVVLTALNFQGKRRIHASVRDMTSQKTLEKQLEHMSYHDQLTDIYNRRFFEEELQRLDVQRNLPLTLIMADVNNLKLINDSFGHATGDQLLILASQLIKTSTRQDEVVARVGGDEFMIILPHTSADDAGSIPERVRNLAKEHRIQGLEISISFGWATKEDSEEDINTILKKAEDSLYKQKLFESPSVRGRTIQTIIHTLHEKNNREEQHSRRVSTVCQVIGKAMNLPTVEIKELESMGLLHDIGKIAIDEQILNNPGKLSEDDWNQMKKHPEIGYRILSTVNDMAEMAEYVLAHHERWDGAGYPKGLKGEDIPLKARIIALADAYDAMTSDRAYRKAIDVEAALTEIRKNAGTQFDPKLAELFVSAVMSHGLIL